MRYTGWIIGLGAGTLAAVALSGLAVDDAFRVHMGILSLVLGLSTIVAMRPKPTSGCQRRGSPSQRSSNTPASAAATQAGQDNMIIAARRPCLRCRPDP